MLVMDINLDNFKIKIMLSGLLNMVRRLFVGCVSMIVVMVIVLYCSYVVLFT